MREIALNGLLLDRSHSGTATYMRNLVPLLPEVAPDLTFRLYTRGADALPGAAATRVSTPLQRLGTRPVFMRLDKLAWEIVAWPAAAALQRNALLHSLYFAAPAVASAPVVVTIHDLIPLILPGYHRSRQSLLYSRFMAAMARRAAAIVTVSRSSRDDIVRLLRVEESRVHVTYEAADSRFHPGEDAETVREAYGLPERFILYIGGAERRKNLELLVRAWRRARRHMNDREVRLVVVARFPPPDALYPDIKGLAGSLGLGESIRFVSSVAEEDKPALYRAALAFCFPSTYEGFGLPPLEAMASGVPVLAARATSLPEVLDDGAMLLPPNDEHAWADALEWLVDSDAARSELAQRGLRRAADFSWQSTAQKTVDVYREVLDG